MIKKFALLLSGIALLGHGLVGAQTPEDPTADEIVTRHVAAIGGKQGWSRVESIRMTGEYSFNGETHPMVILRARPSNFRFELEIDDVPYVIATDGSSAWRFFETDDDHPILMSPDSSRRLLEEWADFEGPLIDYRSKGHVISSRGRTELDGTDCFEIEIVLASGGVQTWYLSTDDYSLVRKTTEQIHSRRGPYQRVWYFESFEREGDLMLPQYFEREDRQHVRAYDIASYELNPTIPASLFSPPPNAKPEE